jgi:hypothetical protein
MPQEMGVNTFKLEAFSITPIYCQIFSEISAACRSKYESHLVSSGKDSGLQVEN